MGAGTAKDVHRCIYRASIGYAAIKSKVLRRGFDKKGKLWGVWEQWIPNTSVVEEGWILK